MVQNKILNKQGAKTTTLDSDADRLRNEQAYLNGELARQNRLPFESCPFAATNPLRIDWERGWYSRRVAEADSDEIVASLLQVGLTINLLDLEELDTDRRFELLDWLETLPPEGFCSERRPAFDLWRPMWLNIGPPCGQGQSKLCLITLV